MEKRSLKDLSSILIGVDQISLEVQQAQTEAELKNAIKRHQERMAKYEAWIDPKEMAERKLRLEKESAESLERLKDAGMVEPETIIPDELPDYLKGQSPSFIRAAIRNGWTPEPKEETPSFKIGWLDKLFKL